jgi:predicted transcriptional regulator
MPAKKLTAAELNVMQILWDHGPKSIRELLERYSDDGSRAYTTVQTLVYRLEDKGALRRTRKIGGAHIFEAVISRDTAQRRMLDELLQFFGGRAQPLVSHLVESGRLSLEDIEAARRQLKARRPGSNDAAAPASDPSTQKDD